ncbi:hypothetical protein WJX73_001028 [Symbiochloris irregularis]|uniref:Uncharacterized protein n=1 Tax=Symbiochloris irregularis TaxID=706552 RepID=A0AAW1P8F8_9CHLO
MQVTAQSPKPVPFGTGAASLSARRCSGIAASNGDSEAAPASGMSTEEACSVLGVTSNAGFEEVLQAKKRLSADLPADSEENSKVETAYDALLMASMKRRLGGEVSTGVRFADVAKSRPRPQAQAGPTSVFGLVNVQQPSKNALAQQSVIFGALAASALLPGIAEPSGSSVPALQIGLSGMASIYFLRNGRSISIPRAVGLAVGCAVLGSVIGGGINSWLRPDIVPIAGISSPATLVSEFVIISLWAACTFLS